MSAEGDRMRALHDVDADRVAPKLWVGSWEPRDLKLREAGFEIIIRVAKELPGAFAGGFVDSSPVTTETIAQAMRAAAEVERGLRRGARVLVSCAQGVNRSAFVAAAAMIKARGMTPTDAIAEVRTHRVVPAKFSYALCNEGFVNVLLSMTPGRVGAVSLRGGGA